MWVEMCFGFADFSTTVFDERLDEIVTVYVTYNLVAFACKLLHSYIYLGPT